MRHNHKLASGVSPEVKSTARTTHSQTANGTRPLNRVNTDPQGAPTSNHGLFFRLQQYALLVRLHKPIGILLLLWPTLWALWIAADGFPGWTLFLVFFTGTVLMRSAGCAMNDYADQHIDRHVSRTRERPLTSGRISAAEAVGVAIVLAFCAFLLLFLTNYTTLLMSIVALALATIYPFSKRFTHLPQLFLGAAFSWGIPMAYTATETPLDKTTWLLFIASVLWALAYDTMYAMVDRKDDLKIGVKSSAILFGEADVPIIVTTQLMMLATLALVGQQEGLSQYYFGGLLLALCLAVYQFFLIRNRAPSKCFDAFLNNNYFGMVVFAGIFLHYANAA
ncbi:MAG TPA: 4-hydroxybenzoate octaprenyltransferase [Gammaproteobacteria bacterium]|jgi:4-hydroxybenzoate polyprenyltransferase|nr:4-hydroxybenzoate octaprenyltransferase [Gammaproteobacteria bacterium]